MHTGINPITERVHGKNLSLAQTGHCALVVRNKYWTSSSKFGCLDVPERPWGVTILGTLSAVNGAFQFSCFFAFSSGAWCAVPLLLSVLSFVLAFGLLLGEDWAWKLTLVVDIIYIALTIGLFALHNAMSHLGVVFIVAYMYPAYLWLLSIVAITPLYFKPTATNIGIIVSLFTFILPDIIFILYLMLPHVKAFFLGTESSIEKIERQNACTEQGIYHK